MANALNYAKVKWYGTSDAERALSDEGAAANAERQTSVARAIVAGVMCGDPRQDARWGAAPLPLSIAPVESGAEVMIERDATTARSDAQLHLLTLVHYTNIVSDNV